MGFRGLGTVPPKFSPFVYQEPYGTNHTKKEHFISPFFLPQTPLWVHEKKKTKISVQNSKKNAKYICNVSNIVTQWLSRFKKTFISLNFTHMKISRAPEATNSSSYSTFSITGDGINSMAELVKDSGLPSGVQSFLGTTYNFAKLPAGKVMTVDTKNWVISFDGVNAVLKLPTHLREREESAGSVVDNFHNRATKVLAA